MGKLYVPTLTYPIRFYNGLPHNDDGMPKWCCGVLKTTAKTLDFIVKGDAKWVRVMIYTQLDH